MVEPFFSIIVPVYNNADQLRICLQSVLASTFADWELIVIDDGSTDDSVAVAHEFGARILSTNGRSGPAAARNKGAKEANGRYLFFTDSDCRLHPNTLQLMMATFTSQLSLDAVIGSYDDAPAAPNFLSQFKNLLHHYTHQTSSPQATTFWTGCGAVKRTVFLRIGGFDAERYPRPTVEDIEFGYRLVLRHNGRIRLAHDVQVKHLKAWHWHSLLRSDICDRALPWTELISDYKHLKLDLNLRWQNRLSGIAILLLVGNFLLLPFHATAFWGILFLLASLCLLNSSFYRFVYTKKSFLFTGQAIVCHWIYYLYSALTFAVGTLKQQFIFNFLLTQKKSLYAENDKR